MTLTPEVQDEDQGGNDWRSPAVSDSELASLSEDEDDNVDDLCPECEVKHIQRRLVVCADGTSMVADGAVGSFHGNATNMARIWSMVKEGVVQGPDRKRWEQKRVFIEGIGAVPGMVERTYAGATGHGYKLKIKTVYKLCCTDLCPADEIFLFGFSRGAFVVRVVAGLLQRMKVLDVTAPDFDQNFDRALRLYSAAQDKSGPHQNQIFQHMSQVKNSPRVKFIGVIDTVKALDDDNLKDIGFNDSVPTIRHALALFEQRTLFHLERFNLDRMMPPGHTSQEAWFAGAHGALGGGSAQDGLSLWPLQWLVSEARKQSLVFGFQSVNESSVTDPAALIFQRKGDKQKNIRCHNGINVTISDLSEVTSKDGFLCRTEKGKTPSPTEVRPLFSNSTLIGQHVEGLTSAFIHPSVFYLDDTNADTITLINNHPNRKLIREQRQLSIPTHADAFWAGSEEIQLTRETERPRILLCGQLNAGKSSLINRMLGYNATLVSHGADPGDHDINVPHQNEERDVIFHDSQGFEAAKASNFGDVEAFVEARRRRPIFDKQIHCIWYCVSTDLQRVQKVDKKFSNINFGGVPLILVFTKSDKLKRTCEEKAYQQYNQENASNVTIYQFSSLSEEVQNDLSRRTENMLESEKRQRTKEWTKHFPDLFSNTIFVSNTDAGSAVTDSDSMRRLMQLSRDSMTGERMARIHAQAQDSFIKSKWDEAIESIIRTCDKKADLISCLKRHDVGKLRRKIVQSITEKLAGIFELDGLDHTAAVPTISEILYPDEDDGGSSIAQYLSIVGGLAIGTAGAALVGPIAWMIAAGSTTSALAIFTDLSNSNIVILSCLEIAFVLERIFWFGASQVHSEHVKAATLYFLKQRTEFWTAGGKALRRRDKINEMTPKLGSLVEQFQYKRRSIEQEGDNGGGGGGTEEKARRPVPPPLPPRKLVQSGNT